MNEIRTLTGLRGYAALWVLFLHYTWGWTTEGWAMAVARQGSAGLTIFFVLSGFILAHVYSEQFPGSVTGPRYRTFLWARLARIYPLHLVTLLLFGLVRWTWFSLQPNDTATTFILNLLLLHAWGFTNHLSWNQPSWSLSAEFFAYLIFPFLIAFAYRLRLAGQVALLLAVALTIWLAPYGNLVSMVLNRLGADTTGIQFAYGCSLIQWFSVFALGVCLQPVAKAALAAYPGSWVWDGAFLVGILLFALVCADPPRDQTMVAAAAFTVVGLYRDRGLGRLVVGNPVAVFLGAISFALYMTHIILIDPLRASVATPLPVLIEALAACGVAAIFHYGLEKPARTMLRAAASRARSSPAGVAIEPARGSP